MCFEVMLPITLNNHSSFAVKISIIHGLNIYEQHFVSCVWKCTECGMRFMWCRVLEICNQRYNSISQTSKHTSTQNDLSDSYIYIS